ncbi:acyltransferase domain-containing protein [Streptomyces sp. 130]|uniref:type I polyketide synthase n=1 Tax=Streptomyces sp. 130 TaxID=2591006 RepID=UPI0011811173|nr:type I polyketide synthase [Streptomyces sp. 130]TRV76672.1 acyltransferase domain-containing protein [Streptomyces sp. 130]
MIVPVCPAIDLESSMRPKLSSTTPLAIVGMACRFPGIESTDDLWNVLVSGADMVTPVPRDRFDADACHATAPMTAGRTVSRHGGFLTDAFGFDREFFGVPPAAALAMDPQQRLLLHVVWEALESAGIPPTRLAGSTTGVFVGQATAEYADTDPRPDEPDVRAMTGSRLRAVTAGRISYALDLRGPSVVLDTACSSSLVAVHAARQSLLTGESDLCVAGGVNVILSPHDAIGYSQGGMLSPTGRCRFGDARADGFVRSEGVGAVVLKRLDDAVRDGDPVHAVLLGSAVTNDGASAGVPLRPSVPGQVEMVRAACAAAGVAPGDLDYVEAHGPGTEVGDAVELEALAEAAGAGRPGDRPLLTGSVKTNIGHAEAAAGIAGLLKAVLILRHGVVPASLHLGEPHPLLTRDGFPVRVVTRARPLDPAGERALLGVSSFGLSGTNAHVVVGAHLPDPEPAAPDPADPLPEPAGTGPHLLVLSARTAGSLRRLAARYADYLDEDGAGRRLPLRDVCAAAATRRDAHPHRLWATGADHDALVRALRALAAGEATPDGGTGGAVPPGGRRVAFVFSGQGAQWAGMGRALYRSSPAFRAALDACDRAVRAELGWSVLDRLLSGPADLPTDVDVVQPVLWALQVALAAAWRERGVRPELCMGHSMGEVAAARTAGALSLDDAAAVICRRSTLMQQTAGRGAMLAVELPADRAHRRAGTYGERVSVAVENAPTGTVLAGDPAALTALRGELERDGVLCRPVKVNVASHSPYMDAVREKLPLALDGLAPAPCGTALVSTVYGRPVEGPALTPAYWAENVRRPVRFAGTVLRVAEEAETVFVEVGPHPVLLAAMEETLGARGAAVASLHRDCDEPAELVRAAGRIFAHGGRVDWHRWYGSSPRHVPSLPTYPWDTAPYRRASAGPLPRTSPERRFDLAGWGGTADWDGGIAVHGVAGVPPVVLLEALRETVREADGDGPFELRGIRLGGTPLPVDAPAGTTLRVTLEGPRDDRAVTVRASLPGAPEPLLCATGRAVRAVAGEPGPEGAGLLDAALARCRDHLPAHEFYALARRHGYDIPEPFAGVEHLWRREGEAVARVRLPGPLPRAGWEVGLQTLLAARPRAASGSDDTAHIPVSFGSVRFHAPLEAEFWSVSRVRQDGKGTITADVLLLSTDHRVLARFTGIRLRRLGPARTARRPLSYLTALRRLAGGAARPAGRVRPVTPPRPAPRVPAQRGAPDPAPAPGAPASGAADTLLTYAAELLGLPAAGLDPRLSLRELGLDSLMAARLRHHLRTVHGTELSAGRLLGAESLAELRAALGADDSRTGRCPVPVPE